MKTMEQVPFRDDGRDADTRAALHFQMLTDGTNRAVPFDHATLRRLSAMAELYCLTSLN